MSGIESNLIAGPSRGSVTQRLPEMSVNIGLSADDSESIRVKASNQTSDKPKELSVRRVLPDDIAIKLYDNLLLTAYGYDIHWDTPERAGNTPNSQYYPGICNQNIAETTRIQNQTLRLKPGQKFTAKVYKTSVYYNWEKEILKSLSHRNVVQLYVAIKLGEDPELIPGAAQTLNGYPRMLLITEHANLGNLSEYINRDDLQAGQTMDTMFKDICLGLQYLHQNGVIIVELSETKIGVYTDMSWSQHDGSPGFVAKWRDLSHCRRYDKSSLNQKVVKDKVSSDCNMLSQMIDSLLKYLNGMYNPSAANTDMWRSVIDQLSTQRVTMDSIVGYITTQTTTATPGPSPPPTHANIPSVTPNDIRDYHRKDKIARSHEALRQLYPNITPNTIGLNQSTEDIGSEDMTRSRQYEAYRRKWDKVINPFYETNPSDRYPLQPTSGLSRTVSPAGWPSLASGRSSSASGGALRPPLHPQVSGRSRAAPPAREPLIRVRAQVPRSRDPSEPEPWR